MAGQAGSDPRLHPCSDRLNSWSADQGLPPLVAVTVEIEGKQANKRRPPASLDVDGIDKLAFAGIVFDQVHDVAPLCDKAPMLFRLDLHIPLVHVDNSHDVVTLRLSPKPRFQVDPRADPPFRGERGSAVVGHDTFGDVDEGRRLFQEVPGSLGVGLEVRLYADAHERFFPLLLDRGRPILNHTFVIIASVWPNKQTTGPRLWSVCYLSFLESSAELPHELYLL